MMGIELVRGLDCRGRKKVGIGFEMEILMMMSINVLMVHDAVTVFDYVLHSISSTHKYNIYIIIIIYTYQYLQIDTILSLPPIPI